MSRLIAVTADEMLAGTKVSARGEYRDTDDSIPGVVVLSSANEMPNPDLRDENARGRLQNWNLEAPPSPDSWNVYIQKTGTIAAGGGIQLVESPIPMLRQNVSLLRWKENTYEQEGPLLTDKSLPDLSQEGDFELAPPLDAPRVRVVTKTSSGGYPTKGIGSLLKASYFGIVGDNPMKSKRITNAAPAVTIPAIAQGQSIKFFLPDDIPSSWSGVGFCVGPDENTMRVQKRVDIRGRVVTEVVDPGPYRRDGMLVTPTSENRTRMGAYEQLGPPRVWRDRAVRDLLSGNYPLAYQLRTQQGWTAASEDNNEMVSNDQNGETLKWAPPKAVLKRPGIQRWRPLFKMGDDNWYTFEDAAENGYPLARSAQIQTRNKEKWKSKNGFKKVGNGRPEKDSSGVPGPVDPMEIPIPQGASLPKPGRYAVRVTTASQEEGLESRPSPRKGEVVLRDTGVFGGGAPSGVTDQVMQVFRPPGQTIKNSRLVEVDPTDGSTELHWERPASTSEVTVADSILTVSSASGTSSKVYRRSSVEPIDATRYYAVRFRMDVDSIGASSTITPRLRFLANEDPSAPGAILGAQALETFSAVGDQYCKYTVGPADGAANFDFPAGTTHVQIEVMGASATARTFVFNMSNIGIWVGRAMPRKVYDLVIAEDTPGRDSWPVPDSENSFKDINYPAGPYVRVVQDPVTPPLHRVNNTIEIKSFDTGDATSNGWTAPAPVGGATLTVAELYALSGTHGVRLDTAPSSAAYSAYVWKNFLSVGRSTFGVEAEYRIKSLPSAGNVGLLGVTRDAGNTNFLAYAELMSTGVIRLQFWNGAAMGTPINVSGITVEKGDNIRLDLAFSNVKTAGTNGSVTLRVKRNDRVVASASSTSNSWSAVDAHRVLGGFFGGSATGSTGRVLMDRIHVSSAAISETTALPGNIVEYWAPEGQPAGNPDYLMTGVRFPVKPSTTYVDSCYVAHDGITTPAVGANLFRIVSFDSDGNTLGDAGDHGFLVEGMKGKRHWDRYYKSYTTPAEAAYVEYTRNHVGDGLIWVGYFQHQEGSTPTAFDNTNATSGSFNVKFKTTLTGGPNGGDVTMNKAILRARAVVTHAYHDTTGAVLSTVGPLEYRGSTTEVGLAAATFSTNIAVLSPYHEYIEVKVPMTCSDNTKSPEVRAVFVDIERDRPYLTREDGRDFLGGIIAYNLTPASPRPNVIRKEMADGSVSLENVGRGQVPEKLRLSLQAFTHMGKRLAEMNPATTDPLYVVEVPRSTEDPDGKRYVISCVPEFTGNAELEPDGVKFYDFVAEDIEADVISTEDL